MPNYLIFIVASLPLPHSYGIMLYASSVRPTCLVCGVIAVLIKVAVLYASLRHHYRLIFIAALLPLPHSCGIMLHASSVRPHEVIAASLPSYSFLRLSRPAFIGAPRHLRHYCHLYHAASQQCETIQGHSYWGSPGRLVTALLLLICALRRL
jgi:hypothetical protein